MKQDVQISLCSRQSMDGETEEIRFTAQGRIYRKKEDFFLMYEEPLENGMEGAKTTIKVEPNKTVTITRYQPAFSQLRICPQQTCECDYDTGYGILTLQTTGKQILLEANDSQNGVLLLEYSLSFGEHTTSTQHIHIQWKQK